MSWKAYEIFSTIPSFDPPPILGLGEVSRNRVSVGQAEDFVSWDGTTGLAFRFRYQPQSPAEWSNLREFSYRQHGIGKSFLLPTWQPDFELDSDAVAGSNEITVADAGFADLTDDRPDTEKRIIFTLTSSLQFQANRVASATSNGDGTETLTLEDRLAFDLSASTDMVGLVYLSRFAENLKTFEAIRPGRGRMDARFLTVRNTRRVNDQQNVSSIAVGNGKAFSDLIATDENCYPYDGRTALAIGPLSYASPQGTPFFEGWRFTLAGNSLSLERTDGTGSATESTLYDSLFESDHLRACFDAVGREVIAWELPTSEFRVAHYVGGTPTRTNIEGRFPALFYTWPIDSSAATAGDGEVLLFYLKPGFSSIFARTKSDDFDTEYQMIRSPSAPLAIHEAVRNGSFLEIRGIDVGHRRAVWRAEYVPPLIPDFVGAELEFSQGEFQLLIRVIEADPEAESVSLDLDSVTGEFRKIAVTETAGPDGKSANLGIDVVGDYAPVNVTAGPFTEDESVELAFLTGQHRLVAKVGQVDDQAAANLEFTSGDYSTP